ncbi:MAG TPA: M20 family metallopeptidase [Chloroflexota bacterium]|nr:M20 family metallopeptidase [Chloroflexota bacterium]
MKAGLQWIEEKTPDLISLASAIWEYAEPSLWEERSSQLLADYLAQEGFEVRRGVGGMPTAFVASWGSGRPIIGYLGEYDALPGLSQRAIPRREPLVPGAPGHGCGHNLLGVGSLGAAVALKRELQAHGTAGTVRYYGCPAEETAIGKVFMAKEGVFDDLDVALSWHPNAINMPNSGTSLALNSAKFAFHGRSSHASAAPHLGVSALDAVELMNVGVNFLREHVPPETRIHYVITNGGSEPNVVPALAEVWYYVRAPHRVEVESVYQRIVKIAEGAALMTGAELEIKFQTGLYDLLPNNVLSDLLEESLRTVGVPSFTEEEREFARGIEDSFTLGQKAAMLRTRHLPQEFLDITLHDGVAWDFDRGETMWGSTDVGDVSWIVPTGQITTACYVVGTGGHSWQAAAASGTSIGHKGMITAARALGFAGYQLVSRPEFLAQAREAFEKSRGDKRYQSPLPQELNAPLAQLPDHGYH